ncbi:hypothetical protein [Leptospira alexanderi]|uniref:hypothetical protein n=1 Tax=Leptospira alexanderi TaxID=100053 RepID=UPI003CC6B7D9
MKFEIKADPNLIPITMLGSHVVSGDAYFDALQGEYELEYNEILNHKEKRTAVLRLRRGVNTVCRPDLIFTRLSGNFLMRDIQNSVLRILKRRIEATG